MTTPLTISLNYSIARMVPGTVCLATPMIGNVALTSGVNWKVVPEGAAQVTNELGRGRIVAKLEGPFVLVCLAAQQAAATIGYVIPLTPAKPTPPVVTPPLPPVVVPPPPPPVVVPPPVVTPPQSTPLIVAPAKLWKRKRKGILMANTDFYYDVWTQAMEAAAAMRYDVWFSGDPARHARMRLVNPNSKFLPYTLEYTNIMKPGDVLQNQYEHDFEQWCADNHISQAQAESAWLLDPTGNRVTTTIWGSLRDIGDPTNQIWRQFTVWRYQQLGIQFPGADGFFIDEFGSNALTANYKRATTDPTRLAAILAAETTLIAEIANAIAPRQLVVNTASYLFQEDVDIAKAGFGVHMEQINNPMNLDWWNTSWPYMERLMAAGVLVNIVPAYQFGEYESAKDKLGNHMDSHRGKLLELAAYYMCVSDPALFAFSIQNFWPTGITPMTYWLSEIDVELDGPIETRNRQPGLKIWQRRFASGLVVVNPISDRLDPNYAAQIQVTLPNDRKYGQVMPDGTTGSQVKAVMMRTPEAAIFRVIP